MSAEAQQCMGFQLLKRSQMRGGVFDSGWCFGPGCVLRETILTTPQCGVCIPRSSMGVVCLICMRGLFEIECQLLLAVECAVLRCFGSFQRLFLPLVTYTRLQWLLMRANILLDESVVMQHGCWKRLAYSRLKRAYIWYGLQRQTRCTLKSR